MFAQLAIDTAFAQFGKAATYTAPAGSPVLCTAVRDTADRELTFGNGRPVLQGDVIELRKSEIAAPVKGGQIKVYASFSARAADVGGETVTVIDDPRCLDPDRLVWTCTVR